MRQRLSSWVSFPPAGVGNQGPRPLLVRVLAALTALLLCGTLGYWWLEGYTWLEALYMTVITLSTVGFGEVRPLSPNGRLFTVVLIMVGVGSAAYLFTLLGDYIVSGELEGTLRRRRWMDRLRKLNHHYLICGCGRMGEQVAQELHRLGQPFVLIDRHPEHLEAAQSRGFLTVHGDPTEEEVLELAGVKRARGLVAVLETDADNLFLVLTARNLNPDLFIVAQAISEATEKKLYAAGADRVVSPFLIAGYRMASWLVRPYVVSFLETTMRNRDLGEMWMEEVRVAPDSELVGKSLAEADIRARTGANVLAIVRGEAHMDWSPNLRIEPNDVLIILGRREQILHIAQMARDQRLVEQLQRSPAGTPARKPFPPRLRWWRRRPKP